jgi:hypothetical protein
LHSLNHQKRVRYEWSICRDDSWYLIGIVLFLIPAFMLIFPNIYQCFLFCWRFEISIQYWDLIILVAWFKPLGNFNFLILLSCVFPIILNAMSYCVTCNQADYPLLNFCLLHRLMAIFTARRKKNSRRKYGNLIIESILRYWRFNSSFLFCCCCCWYC